MPEVARFEPPLALFAGDGLDVLRRLVAAAPAPFVALEHGAGQADAVEALAARRRASPRASGSATWRASSGWWSARR